MTLVAGSVLGSYRIIRLLGEGGMGCVYEAEHVGLKVRRAVKVFSTESEHGDFLRKRFVAEGRILADLQHPRIVRVYDFAVDEATGTPYFAMDLVVSPTGEPQTLEKACRDGVDEEQVAGWFRDICAGLGYIHGKGIIHRDISLDNILIDPEGRAVLTDFGIAKITGESYRRKIDVTVTMLLPVGEGLRMGKGLYMAPELKAGTLATVASDAYAVGVIVFRLLVGAWYTPHARLEDVLAGLECYDWAVSLRGLLAEDPAQRMSLEDAVAALSSVRRQTHKSKLWWMIVALATVAAAIAFGVVFGGRTRIEGAGTDEAVSMSPSNSTIKTAGKYLQFNFDPDVVNRPKEEKVGAMEELGENYLSSEHVKDPDLEKALGWLLLLACDEDEDVTDKVSELIESIQSERGDVWVVRTLVRIIMSSPNGDVVQAAKMSCAEIMGQDFTTEEAAEAWCNEQE